MELISESDDDSDNDYVVKKMRNDAADQVQDNQKSVIIILKSLLPIQCCIS